MRILYIIGCNEGESKRYRVFNLMEALNELGIESDWHYEIHEQIYNHDYLKKYDIAILFRCGWSQRLERLIGLLKQIEIPVVFDIDDLVFDTDIADQIAVYQTMDENQKQAYLNGVKMVNQVLQMCDYATASTNYLCDYINKKYAKPTFMIPNGINREQIEISRTLMPYQGSIRYIGYFSGTNTHQKDFGAAAAALTRILDKYPDVYLKIVGFLDAESYFPNHKNRIIARPFMDWREMLVETANLYLNLAPLDINSPYSHAKSQLKYFEAALCGVPTVCSLTEPFVDVIESGKNGYLAEGEEEWFAAMDAMLADPELRNRVARRAKNAIKKNFYPDYIASTAVHAYQDIIFCRKNGRFPESAFKITGERKNRLKISFIIPQPFEGSGGHRNIFRAIKYLSEFGHDMTVYVNPDNHRFKDSAEVEQFITKNFFDLKAEVVWWATNIQPCDVLVATHWSTAYIVDANREKASLHCYFIQDFEPYFYSMGYEYVISYHNYNLGFYPITSGPWPLRLLERDFGITEGDYFRFPIDRKIYYPNPVEQKNDHPRIAFFARPDMPRRCYHLGVQGLQLVKQMHPEAEIIFYGAHSSKYVNVPFEFTNCGMLPEISMLGDLYRSCDLGVCFSTTNPSLVPYEMMACGCPVVDLDFNENEVNYGSRENVTLVGPSAHSIAEGVNRLLEDPEYKERVRANGQKYCDIFPEEEEMVRLIESFILKQYEKKQEEVWNEN